MRSKSFSIVAASFAAIAIAIGSSGIATAHSGGGGGGHGGGGHGGGGHGGGGHGGGGYRGGWHGHGGYGRGWYGRGFYGGWGLGLYYADLPWYYDTYWWNGVPYYYADDVYYQWNADADAYQTIAPPAALADQIDAQGPPAHQLFVYPKAGQTNEQMAQDREECHRWAVSQTGFDPRAAAEAADTATPSKPATAQSAAAKRADNYRRADYYRAEGACLQGRNYSVN